METNSNDKNNRFQGRGESTQTIDVQLMEIMKAEEAKSDGELSKSRSSSFGMPRRAEKHLVSQADVLNIVKS